MNANLTQEYVDGLKSEVKDYTIWDTSLPAFGVRVHPGGRKSYVGLLSDFNSPAAKKGHWQSST